MTEMADERREGAGKTYGDRGGGRAVGLDGRRRRRAARSEHGGVDVEDGARGSGDEAVAAAGLESGGSRMRERLLWSRVLPAPLRCGVCSSMP